MEYKNYYKTLGVEKNASNEEIRQVYRKLARKFHPDLNPGNKRAEEKFKEINEAYEVLNDPEKKVKYDQLGADWENISRQQDFFRQKGFESAHSKGTWRTSRTHNGVEGDFSDFFKAFFSDVMGEETERRFSTGTGSMKFQNITDIEQTIEITLEQAYNGTSLILKIDSRKITVKIPAGIKDGSKLRIKTEGIYDPYGEASNLLLTVRIKPHQIFKREEDNIHYEAEVPLFTAVLGGEIKIPTLKGNVSMKIPPETQNYSIFRLKNLGMPYSEDSKGDQLVRIKVILPTKLTEKEKKLFEELKNIRYK